MSGLAPTLRLLSTLACAVVTIAFVMWAADEGRMGRDGQVAQIELSDQGRTLPAPGGAPPAAPADPDADHDGVRGVVESLNDALVSPFDGFAGSDNAWAAHGIPALLALLTYGLLGRLLIAYVPVRR
jgi:hypothetical protein